MIAKTKIEIQDETEGYITENYVKKAGGFCTFNPGSKAMREIVMCRETMAGRMGKGVKHVGYVMDGLNLSKLNRFFRTISDRLKPRKTSVTFYPTQYKNAVVVYLPPFWRRNDTNRSFFTLFLRCGAGYYDDNFEKALENYNLSKSIIPAINWFLAGNTVATYGSVGSGVYHKFLHFSSEKSLADMLRTPKPTEEVEKKAKAKEA